MLFSLRYTKNERFYINEKEFCLVYIYNFGFIIASNPSSVKLSKLEKVLFDSGTKVVINGQMKLLDLIGFDFGNLYGYIGRIS